MKTLIIFDFDDTLFHSGARVKLKRSDGTSQFLSTHEYAIYEKQPGDKFSYEEFSKYPPSPEPIAKTTRALQSAVLRFGIENVIILTARQHGGPVEQVLEDFHMPPVEVIAISSSVPSHKGRRVRSMVKKQKYQKVVLYEDSLKNIQAIRDAVEPILGNKFIAFHIKPDGSNNQLRQESQSRTLRATQKALELFG